MKNVTIVGTGTQGAMIAFRCAYYDKNVKIYDVSAKQIENTLGKIDMWANDYIEKGKLTLETASVLKDHIIIAQNMADALLDCDIVIENVPERAELKQKVWAEIESHASPETLFASNSSSMKGSIIFKDILNKDKTFNVNFADPILDDMVEVMWNDCTSEKTKAEATEFLKSLGCFLLISQKEIKGYAINRVWRAIKKECLFLWANGNIDPTQFDEAIVRWGLNNAPFATMDKIGLDIVYDIEMSYYDESGDPSDMPPKKLKEMIEAGKLGKKSGEGFYKY